MRVNFPILRVRDDGVAIQRLGISVPDRHGLALIPRSVHPAGYMEIQVGGVAVEDRPTAERQRAGGGSAEIDGRSGVGVDDSAGDGDAPAGSQRDQLMP